MTERLAATAERGVGGEVHRGQMQSFKCQREYIDNLVII